MSETQNLLDTDIEPRPLRYPLSDYQNAVGGDGDLAHTWADKPHRLIYDLIAAVKFYSEKDDTRPVRDAL